jgi:ribonuclease BN (tRNA processing enzyme)
MEIRVLGCYGGELPGYRVSSFVVDGKLLLDAGAVTSVLRLSEQLRIEAILVTHTHLDHIRDIPFLAANLLGERTAHPIHIVSTRPIIEGIKAHLFNDALWPDFTVLPSAESPVLKFMAIEPMVEVPVQDFTIRAIPVNHTVPAVGYIVHRGKSSMVYTGDTGPTERIWEEANLLPDLKAVLVETSFPNRMRAVAESSGHLTPMMLKRELKKLRGKEVPVLLVHMKPQHLEVLQREVDRWPRPGVTFSQPGKRYRF